MLRALLCDLDDTLFDHWRGTRLALAAVRAEEPALSAWAIDELEARHRVVLEKWHQHVLAGTASIDAARIGRFAELLSAAGVERTDERAAGVAAIYRRQYASVWHPVPGAVELAVAVKGAGLRLAIVTNNVVVEQRLKLTRCGLDRYVDALITSEEVGAQKPDTAIFDAALARVQVDRSEAVMLGDAWHTDVEGALAAGVRPVWFNRFGEASPDPTVAQLRSLEPTIEALVTLQRTS